MLELVDTHCHIHSADYDLNSEDPTQVRWLKAGKPNPDEMIEDARSQGVTRLICVGTDLQDSRKAVDFVQDRDNCWATIGIHPHEASRYVNDTAAQDEFMLLASQPKIVAIGECGLDYFYTHSSKEDQMVLLKFQIDVATQSGLPLVFHVREAFEDFWPIFDEYKGLRGVIHSFSATQRELDGILERGLYAGLNGIMTFTKNAEQLDAAKALPLQKILLETDAPFLTPHPFRGKMCKPEHTRVTAEFLGNLRGESLESLAMTTTRNARELFKI